MYVCMYVCMYIYIYIYTYDTHACPADQDLSCLQEPHAGGACGRLHSAKGGAVETGCSGSHYITGCFVT